MAAGDLTDLASVRAMTGVSSTNDDAYLASLITAISAYVPISLCRAGILTATYQEIRTGNGRNKMLLRQGPVQQVSLVEWQGYSLATQGDIINGTGGIATDGRSVYLINDIFPVNMPVRITYVAGWTTVPADMQNAVTELVAEAYTRRKHIGEVTHSQGGATTVSFDQKDMHAAIAAKLKNYLRVAPL